MDTHVYDTDDPRTKAGLAVKARCTAALKAQYEVLPISQVRQFRPTFVSRDTAELAHKMTERRTEIAAGKRTHDSLQRKAARLCEQLGMPLALARDATSEQVQGWEDMLAVRREVSAGEGDEAGPDEGGTAVAAPVKTYVLKQPAAPLDVTKLRKRVWAAWHRVEMSGASVSRHALTQKTLGHNHSVNDFTAEECARMLDVFNAVAPDAKKKS